jgi:hypothetical protein
MLAALDQDGKSEQIVCALADRLLGEEAGLSLRNTIVVVKALILPRVCAPVLDACRHMCFDTSTRSIRDGRRLL